MIRQDNKQGMVKHGFNFVKVHICCLVNINKVIFEDKSRKVISKELKNEKEKKDTNVPDATERIVSVVKDIPEAQDENSEVPIEISSEAEEVQEVGEEEEEGEKEEENNKRMQQKETEVVEQLL